MSYFQTQLITFRIVENIIEALQLFIKAKTKQRHRNKHKSEHCYK